MKTFLAVISIALTIVGLLLPSWNAEKPDVKYTLTERIPVSLANDKPAETIQQLVIKNTGNSKAEAIVIKADALVTSYEIQKFSQADKVEEYKKGGKLELVYSELPPQGSFTVLIKSAGDGLVSSVNFSVSHSKGKAIDALSQKETTVSDIIMKVIPFIFFLFLILWITWAFIESIVSSFERQAKWGDIVQFLSRSKPFYLTKEKWTSLRDEAVKRLHESYNRYYPIEKIESSPLFKILSESKPSYLTSEEWTSLLEKYIVTFEELLSRNLDFASYQNSKKLLELLSLEKPKHYPEKSWQKLRTGIQDRYINSLKYNLILRNAKQAFDLLAATKPKEIDDKGWNDYREFIQKAALTMLQQEFYYQKEPISYLEQYPIEQLGDSERENLQDKAYRLQYSLTKLDAHEKAERFLASSKPQWMKEYDYSILKSEAELIVKSKNMQRDYQNKFTLLSNLIQGEELPEQCSEIDRDIWDKLKHYEKVLKGIAELKSRLEVKETTAESTYSEANALKEKVQKQLKIINDLFCDPESIKRIEDYDNPFAVGNFENLKKMGSLLTNK